MALEWIRDVGEFGRIGLWQISEELDFLLNRLSLSDRDQNIILGMTNENRKKQWLVARLLVKELVGRQCEVVYDESGRPSLSGSNTHISFSHSADMVASMVNSKHEVGIDIQETKGKIQNIQHKFLSAKELKHTAGDLNKLHIYWCAKEALFKFYGKGNVDFRKHLYIHDFENEHEGIMRGEIRKDDCNQMLDLKYEQLGNYFLVYVEKIVTT